MSAGYRERFVKGEEAAHYDRVVYAPGTVSDVLWKVESKILSNLVDEVRETHERMDYLDFACGTGRIISFLEDKVDTATGIDVSQAMLDLAADKVTDAALVCKDITSENDPIEAKYDLITAFRFMLNAEPSLRKAALRRLAMRLKGPDSVLLVNTHGNPVSHKALFLPYHWLRGALTGHKSNYITTRKAVAEIKEAGLEVERIIGMGFISQKLYTVFGSSLCLAIERHLAGTPLLQTFGVIQLYVCRLPCDHA